ncbi:MAG: HD domain-containing protein, partial [Candidatus Omnitrophota bacterium]|nr:HD domain-containing protein [Candidatus Omnitrophota bacterium]
RGENIMDKKFVFDLKINEKIDSVFILRKKNLKLTKYDKPYLQLSFQDKTGKIEGRSWENAEKFNEAVETGDVVRVKGTVDKYREEKQLKVDFLEKADERAFRYEDMVRVVENRDEIYGKILEYFKTIKNPWILSLAEQFAGDDDLMSRFIGGIGAKSWHNAYVGGLIEHTYEVMVIVDRMCELYPEADRDIMIIGSFIHDIGKIFELDSKNLEYTVEGGLLGHIAIGHKILVDMIGRIRDFPRDLCLRIEHIILSHHGEYEQQSPVLPKTLEATIVYQADELVSQANAVKEIRVSQSEEGKVWSDFVGIKGRKYYVKDAGDEDWKGAGPGEIKEGSNEKAGDSGSAENLFGD